MVLRWLLYALAVIQFTFGLGLLLVPEIIGQFYGGSMDITAVAIARYWAAALLGLAYISWAAATTVASTLRLAIVRAYALTSLVGLVATFIAVSAGTAAGVVINTGGLVLNVTLTGAFLLGFAYYGWIRTSDV